MGRHVMDDFFRFLPGPQPVIIRYGATAAMVLLTFALRVALHDRGGPYQFILFVPAVVVSALLFDRGTGFFAVALSAGLAAALFPWQQAPQDHIAALTIFVAIGSGLVLVSEALHRALERAYKAEREARLLLEELSHRVKNKFAMVVSMIALQAREAPPDTQAALEAIGSRVRVIAKVHDYLQRFRHAGLVDMREYLSGLCRSLEEALCEVRQVRLLVSADQVALPSEKALSVGLIVNELVTNALKYAFPDERAGIVRVQFEKRGATLCLSIADDGIGCTRAGSGFGTKLVTLLTAQLGGSAKWEPLQPGCRVVAEIPYAPLGPTPPDGRPSLNVPSGSRLRPT